MPTHKRFTRICVSCGVEMPNSGSSKKYCTECAKERHRKIDVNICEISEIQVNTYLLQMKSNGLGQEVWKELTILPEIP